VSACKRDLAEDAETKKYPLASKHADSHGPSSNSMANSSSPSFSAAVLGCEANCQRRSPNRKPRSRSSRTAPRRELAPPPACIALQACSLSPVKLLNVARRCSCKARNVPSLRPLLQFGSQQPRRGGPVERVPQTRPSPDAAVGIAMRVAISQYAGKKQGALASHTPRSSPFPTSEQCGLRTAHSAEGEGRVWPHPAAARRSRMTAHQQRASVVSRWSAGWRERSEDGASALTLVHAEADGESARAIVRCTSAGVASCVVNETETVGVAGTSRGGERSVGPTDGEQQCARCPLRAAATGARVRSRKVRGTQRTQAQRCTKENMRTTARTRQV
jgi:hypothetical protein